MLSAFLWFNFTGDFNASAYCLQGRTASGGRVRSGIIAADPRVLPLGTRVKITNAGNLNGVYTVADTGGAIKGNRVDIWTSSCSTAIKFGRKRVKIQKL